jgi:sodium/proline symporter
MFSYTFFAIFLYFLMLVGVGVYAMQRSTSNNSEYLLGGRNVNAGVTALSAGASDMSGWMLMGLPGAAFVAGLDAMWIAVGLIIGAYVNYQVVAPRLRVFTALADDTLTIPEFFAQRFARPHSAIRIIAAVVIILFFTVYTASGLVAGGKLFAAALGAHYVWGIIATVSIVVLYTVLGGFLAVSIGDFIQGVIMLLALIAVPLVTFGEFEPAQMSHLSESVSLNITSLDIIATVSLLTWGLGYFGQPHIIVRFMAIKSPALLPRARWIGLSWMSIAIFGAVMTGLVGASYFAGTNIEGSTQSLADPETVFIELSQLLFHPFIAGWLLAAILAAIMSTISSQLLVSSSSLVEDIYKQFSPQPPTSQQLLIASRVCVLIVAVVAVLIALDSESSVLGLVANAWAGFGAAFGPVVILSLWWQRLTYAGALAGIVVGALTVLVWSYVPVTADGQTLSVWFYELLPGFIASTIAIIVVSLCSAPPASKALTWFAQTQQKVAHFNAK